MAIEFNSRETQFLGVAMQMYIDDRNEKIAKEQKKQKPNPTNIDFHELLRDEAQAILTKINSAV